MDKWPLDWPPCDLQQYWIELWISGCLMTYVANYAVYIVIAGMMVAKGRNEDGQC